MSAAACANWAANFVVTISFLSLLNAITDAGTFFMFAFLTVLALIYFWQRVPETKGLQLADISAGRGRPRPAPALVPAQASPRPAARHAAAPARAHRHAR
jgi:hypothetical protein